MLTNEELQQILNALKSNAQDISRLEAVTGLDGVTSLPAAADGGFKKVPMRMLIDYVGSYLMDKSLGEITDRMKAIIATHPYAVELASYGMEYDTAVSSPKCMRIGNGDLHKTLPVHSRLKGCMLDDDGKVVEYLNPKDWRGNTRDGSRGQVMVEIPAHYRKFETDGTKRRVRISELPLPGYHKVPKMYVSAYEAALHRPTNTLASVVNDGADYRGGDNKAEWDGTYRSFLGRPVTGLNRTDFRACARKRKTGSDEWNILAYEVYKAVYWLFVTEYSTLNGQEPYNAELTSEGLRQGGLGAGVTTWNGNWGTFNGNGPIVPCGHTDRLGNGTGTVGYTVKGSTGSLLTSFDVPRYRGIENPFGHIWMYADGINVRISPDTDKGGDGLSKVFVCDDPAKYNDDNYTDYSHAGNAARGEGWGKEIIFGEYGDIIPSITGGGSTSYFCDYSYTAVTNDEALRGVMFGGVGHGGEKAGLAAAYYTYGPNYSSTTIGTRLCFIPKN